MKIVALFPETHEHYENQLLSTSHALGLQSFLENKGHDFALLKKDEEVENHLNDMDVVISSPFLPIYMTKARMQQATNLKLAVTAGVGSDHVDLNAAIEHNVTIAEVTGSNQISVAEHTVMNILILLRNFLEGHRQATQGEWNLPKVGNNAHDLEGKTVGFFGFGQIGQLAAQRLEPFDVNLQHYDPQNSETLHGSQAVSFDDLIKTSDVITIHAPLTEQTNNLFDRNRLMEMKQGAYLINTARGKIVDTEALPEVLESGHLSGYAGDVWYPQPAPADHPWRTMPSQAMTIHYSGMTLEAQKRIEDGVKDMLNRLFEDRPMQPKDIIVESGKMSSSYSVE